MNLLFTSNLNYLRHIIEVVRSIESTTPGTFDVFIISDDIKVEDIIKYQEYYKKSTFHVITIDETSFKDARTSKRYPLNIYYRIFAGYLINVEVKRILYLDPDVVVIKDLTLLYNISLDDKIMAGASHLTPFLKFVNRIKNRTPKDHLYINTGILLMDLDLMRKTIKKEDIYRAIDKYSLVLTLPDQDIINILYGDKLKLIEKEKYNYGDRDLNKYNLFHPFNKRGYKYIDDVTVIIHYYGRNKPWKKNYKGILNKYYKEIVQL